MFNNKGTRYELAAIGLFSAIGCGVFAELGGELKSPQLPKDPEALVNIKPNPQVGDVVTAHNITIRLHSAVLGVGGRGKPPIGTTSVLMSFTDQLGRDMVAVLKTVNHPAQAAPNVKDFYGYNVEGCDFKIKSIGRDGRIKVDKI
jgi:hypothetical protein